MGNTMWSYRIENKIIQSIKSVINSGGTIITGDYGVKWNGKKWVYNNRFKRCCPFGAVLLTHQPSNPNIHESLFSALNVDSVFLWDFLPAFDKSQNIYLDYTVGGKVAKNVRKFLENL